VKVRFKASFATDLRSLKDKALLGRIKQLIVQIESAQGLSEVSNLKKLRGGCEHYRVRLGDSRVGMVTEEGVVVFVRGLQRREIYRYFP
jgi:mRNA interferase RelE/StbE